MGRATGIGAFAMIAQLTMVLLLGLGLDREIHVPSRLTVSPDQAEKYGMLWAMRLRPSSLRGADDAYLTKWSRFLVVELSSRFDDDGSFCVRRIRIRVKGKDDTDFLPFGPPRREKAQDTQVRPRKKELESLPLIEVPEPALSTCVLLLETL
jgi:hypothetical protein